MIQEMSLFYLLYSTSVPASRIIPLGMKDNFWEMGETGPCGICTEIHYIINPANLSQVDYLLENSVEIWNIVFIQFFRFVLVPEC